MTDPVSDIVPPLTVAQVATMLNVSERTVYKLGGLDWIEYIGSGKRPIRRVTLESVQRLLQRRRGA